jgi:hypothetical protein
MRSAIRSRSMRFWSGTLLAFVGWFVVVPESALAECSSHYVPSISLSWGLGTGLDTLNRAGDLAVADVTDTHRAPKPCTGEMCSSRPAMPVSPAPPEILRVGAWAILERTTVIASPDRSGFPHDAGSVRPTHSPSSIFHPPRLSPSLHIS